MPVIVQNGPSTYEILAGMVEDQRLRRERNATKERQQQIDAINAAKMRLDAGEDPVAIYKGLAELGLKGFETYSPDMERQAKDAAAKKRLGLADADPATLTGMDPSLRAHVILGDDDLGASTEGVALAGGYGGEESAKQAANIAAQITPTGYQQGQLDEDKRQFNLLSPYQIREFESRVRENDASAGASTALTNEREADLVPKTERNAEIAKLTQEIKDLEASLGSMRVGSKSQSTSSLARGPLTESIARQEKLLEDKKARRDALRGVKTGGGAKDKTQMSDEELIRVIAGGE